MAQEAQTPGVDWDGLWQAGRTGWHRSEVNKGLIKYHDLLVGSDGASSSSPKTVFVPLCGKTVDMMWLADQGHSVVGIDLVPKAIAGFIENNSLQATTSSATTDDGDSLAVHKMCAKSAITLYCGDLFKLSSSIAGDIDFIWDRGSFVAIGLNPAMRHKYAAHMRSLLKPGGRILMEKYCFLHEEHGGPPFPVSNDDLQEYYAADFDIEILQTYDAMDMIKARFTGVKTRWDLSHVLLTRKA